VHFFSLQALALNARRRVLRSEGVSAREPSASAGHTWSTVDLGLIDSYGLHMLSYPAGELATYLRPTSSLMEHAFDVLEQVLGDFMRLGRAHGFKVRVLLIPSPSRVLGRLAILHYPHLLAQLEQQGVHIDPGLIDVDAPTRRVLSICGRLGLDCVDPTARLSRLGARAFFPDDEHPTVAGHRALAEALLAH
jgi:hypothetical protein